MPVSSGRDSISHRQTDRSAEDITGKFRRHASRIMARSLPRTRLSIKWVCD
jgi:hypothetical protein